MIQEFVDRFMAAEAQMREHFGKKHPDDYAAIVRAVVEVLAGSDGYDVPDPDRITQIDHGDYRGTLLFVIAEKGFQPSNYWAVSVNYGSCSGCDTLEGIRSYEDDPPTAEQVEAYWTLALHIVQRLKHIAGWGYSV